MTRREVAIACARASLEGGTTTFRMTATLAMPRIEPQLWISVVGAITLVLAMLAALVVLR